MSMIDYRTPGVYIEEVPGGTRPIQAVGTRTAGFVGVAPDADAQLNKSVAINNWAQFRSKFFTPDASWTHLAHAVNGFFLNGGSLIADQCLRESALND